MAATGSHTGSSDVPAVGSLWVGPELDWIGSLCLMSFLHRGHKVTLFHTHDIANPGIEGLELVPAREVFEYDDVLLDRLGPAQFADIFRLNMIRKAGLVWVDMDVLSCAPLSVQNGRLFGYEASGWINNAVLSLPAESAALDEMVTCFDDPSFVPPWLEERVQKRAAKAPQDERLYRACELNPTALGPRALSHMLEKHDEAKFAHTVDVLNPVPWTLVDCFFNPCGGVDGWLTDATQAVHLYASRIRKVHKRIAPSQGSYIAGLANEIGFDFEKYGLSPGKAVPPSH